MTFQEQSTESDEGPEQAKALSMKIATALNGAQMIDDTEMTQHDGEESAMQKLQEAGSAELPDNPCATKKSYTYKADVKSREMHCLRSLWKTAHEFGFNIDGRITLRDLETGKVFD
jgi:hypothetical protein